MDTKTKGSIGEKAAVAFLVKRGFRISATNYRKKWGEIDIIAFKDGILHFFEVKSVTEGRFAALHDRHVPEENVHPLKMRKISRMIQTYLLETGKSDSQEFQFDVLCVFLNLDTRKCRIKWIRNVIL